MTLAEYVSDIITVLTRNKQNRDSRINRQFIASLIHQYRAKEVRDSASRNDNETDNSMWQSLGVVEATPVNSTDDMTLPNGCKTLGRITIPTPIYIPGNNGLRLFTASGQKRYDEVSMDQFFDMPTDMVHGLFTYFYRIGLNAYFYYDRYVKPVMLLDNPMDGFVFASEYVASGNLTYNTDYTVAQVYKVEDNFIVHNGVTYNVGDTFTAVGPNFTGAGRVKYNLQKRNLGWDDPYPMSAVMFEVIKAKIFKYDFATEMAMEANDNNNAQDDSKAN